MGFSYLNGKLWKEVTREERFFCSLLYWQIRKNPASFINWLNHQTALNLSLDIEWEVGYEVCLYRDLLKFRDQHVKSSSYSGKRTFDLCLFSENNIIIIEAKVQQPFKGEQTKTFRKDKEYIGRLIGKRVGVKLIAIASSDWINNHKRYGENDLISDFDAIIAWKHIADLYTDQDLMRADSLYKK